MVKTRIVVPITATTVQQALRDIDEANALADIIELRLDYVKKPEKQGIYELVKACNKPVICTCRPVKEGGKFVGDEEERASRLCRGIVADASFVDIEFSTEKKFREQVTAFAEMNDTKVILSAHFLDRTPNRDELDDLFNSMAVEKPFAIKIVGTAQTEKDNDTIIGFMKQYNRKGMKLIAFCMGLKGTRSRIEAVHRGPFLTFASLGKRKESAKGQITAKEMQKNIPG